MLCHGQHRFNMRAVFRYERNKYFPLHSLTILYHAKLSRLTLFEPIARMSHASMATRRPETAGLTFSPPRSYGEGPGVRPRGCGRRTGGSGTSPSVGGRSLRPFRQTFEFI